MSAFAGLAPPATLAESTPRSRMCAATSFRATGNPNAGPAPNVEQCVRSSGTCTACAPYMALPLFLIRMPRALREAQSARSTSICQCPVQLGSSAFEGAANEVPYIAQTCGHYGRANHLSAPSRRGLTRAHRAPPGQPSGERKKRGWPWRVHRRIQCKRCGIGS